jgi:hypothetical protein
MKINIISDIQTYLAAITQKNHLEIDELIKDNKIPKLLRCFGHILFMWDFAYEPRLATIFVFSRKVPFSLQNRTIHKSGTTQRVAFFLRS